jgi:hypothetical protein
MEKLNYGSELGTGCEPPSSLLLILLLPSSLGGVETTIISSIEKEYSI